VDVNHFRDRKDDSFLNQVRSVADKVRSSGQAIKLDPMNSYQRRLVHNLFKDDPSIRTWSPEDESRMKRITLLPRNS
jgi:spoIIIJ-associated protein